MLAIQLLARGAAKDAHRGVITASIPVPTCRLFSQTPVSPTNSRLVAATEALIEAASSEDQKEVIVRLDSLNEHVAGLKSEMVAMKSEISAMKQFQQDERKDKRIERAMKLVHLESFQYYDDYSKEQSSDLAKTVLEWFLLGQGMFIDGLTMEDVRWNNQAEKDASAQAFRDKFKNQIKSLIGKEPNVFKKDDGRYVIHYA